MGLELYKACAWVIEYHLTIVLGNINTLGVLPIGKVIILKTCLTQFSGQVGIPVHNVILLEGIFYQ